MSGTHGTHGMHDSAATSHGDAGRRLVAWLRLPGLPGAAAVSYRPGDDEVDGVPILELVLRAVRRALGPVPCVIGYRSPEEHGRLQPAATLAGMTMIALEPVTPLRQHMTIVRDLDCDDLCVLQPASALAPSSLAHWLYARHVEGQHPCTRLACGPSSVSPLIFSRAALEHLLASQAAAAGANQGGPVDVAVAAYAPPPEVAPAASSPLPEDIPLRTREDWQALGRALKTFEDRRASSEQSRSVGRSGGRSAGRSAGQSDAHPSALDCWLDARAIITPPSRNGTGRRPRPASRRVLYVSSSAALAGGEHMLVKASRELAKTIDLQCLLVAPGAVARMASADVPVIAEGVSFGEPNLGSFVYCHDILKRVRPQVVHCNGVVDWPMIAAAIGQDVPIIQHVRVGYVRDYADQFGRATFVVPVSKFVARELSALPIDSRRVKVLYDGIDTHEFQRTAFERSAMRAAHGIPPHAFVVLCIARYSAQKRLDLVVNAFGALHAHAPDAILCIVGEPEEPSYYEAIWDLIDSKGLRGAVRHFEGITDIRTIEVMADALVSASEHDPLPNCILEAMAMEVPVIAVRSGGVPEMVDDESASLVPPQDVAAIAEALRLVYDRDPRVAPRVERARRIVVNDFSIAAHARGLVELYNAALGDD